MNKKRILIVRSAILLSVILFCSYAFIKIYVPKSNGFELVTESTNIEIDSLRHVNAILYSELMSSLTLEDKNTPTLKDKTYNIITKLSDEISYISTPNKPTLSHELMRLLKEDIDSYKQYLHLKFSPHLDDKFINNELDTQWMLDDEDLPTDAMIALLTHIQKEILLIENAILKSNLNH